MVVTLAVVLDWDFLILFRIYLSLGQDTVAKGFQGNQLICEGGGEVTFNGSVLDFFFCQEGDVF